MVMGMVVVVLVWVVGVEVIVVLLSVVVAVEVVNMMVIVQTNRMTYIATHRLE